MADEVTIHVEDDGSEPPSGGAEASTEAAAEALAEAAVEVAEEHTDAAVAIAEIEAERDITIAVINAETTEAVIDHEREREEWHRSSEALQSENSRLAMELAEAHATIASLTPPPSEELATEESLASLSESDVVDPPAVAVEAVEEPVRKPKRSRWI
jgi:hypothetical protein